MTNRRHFIRGALAVAGLLSGAMFASLAPASAAEPIKIGELNSYNKFAAFTVPYRNGWQLALEEINATGGVLGRQLEIISRDDGGTTGDAVRIAEELVTRENVDFLFGGFLSNVGLALSDYANQNKLLYIAAEPLADVLTIEKGNRYTFRMRPNTHMQTAMLVQAIKDSGIKKWAIVVPNYAYGQSAAANFKILIEEFIPGAEIVAEQYPALGKIDAGATVSAIDQAGPTGIFNALFGGDLIKFVREGNTRGLFENKEVISLLTGEPEWLKILKDEAPEGWLVTGYPWEQIEDTAHQTFVASYRAKYDDTPRLGSLLGYTLVYTIKKAIETAGSTETEAMITAMEGLKVDTVAGPITMRAVDHQSSLGAWVGRLAVKNGEGTMVDWTFQDGTPFMTPEAEIRQRRPQ